MTELRNDPQRSQRRGHPTDAARFAPRALTGLEQTFVAARVRYLCGHAASSGSTAPAAEVSVRYELAIVHHEANQFDLAAPMFRDLVLNYSAPQAPADVLDAAANLYLDSLNVLAARADPPRPACRAQMAADLPRLQARLCTGAIGQRHEELCRTTQQLQCQMARLEAEQLSAQGQHGSAAQGYMALAARGECGASNGAAEVLYNAALEYDAAAMPADARRARELLVRRFLPHNHPLARRASDELRGAAALHGGAPPSR